MRKLLLGLTLALGLACQAQEKIIILNEGNWQADNGQLSYFEDGVVTNQWFRKINGSKIGDTPNDIIQINDNLIAMAINWSNIVQFISPDGKAVAATEDVPNNRKLASDGSYAYLSSYGHECETVNGLELFDNGGYVAKIDVREGSPTRFKVVKAVGVGYEPEGIAYYKGHLFVANTGGYAFQEDHEYEHTVSVINAATMEVVRTVDVETINLYGKMSQSGQYLCINSPGDYYEVMPAVVILDCQAVLDGKPDSECFARLDECAATYNTTNVDGTFYAIGSKYSYITGDYKFNYLTIDPALCMESYGAEGVYEDDFPGTMMADIKGMQMPYCLYVNPYTGYKYGADAGGFVEGGTLYQWNPEGELMGRHQIYINPGHMLALPPDGHFQGIADAVVPDEYRGPKGIFNLQGIRVTNPTPGHIYIIDGKKIRF